MFKIFISGFPLDMTELELVQFVAPYGTVETIKIVRDKKTRKCKGYAFLEMATEADAQNAAYELNGTYFKKRLITVNVQAPEIKVTSPITEGINPKVIKNKRPRRPIG
jgi:RNA recognition motif-containing protein